MKKQILIIATLIVTVIIVSVGYRYIKIYDPLDFNCRIIYDPFVGPREGHHCHGFIGDLDNPISGGYLDVKENIIKEGYTKEMQYYKNNVYYKNNHFYYTVDKKEDSQKNLPQFLRINIFSGDFQTWNNIDEIPLDYKKIYIKLEKNNR